MSNEDILKLIENFENLNYVERDKKAIGGGAYKDVYDLSDDYVLKTGNPKELIKDYLNAKEMGRIIPVEQPMLVSREGKDTVQVQRKLKTLNTDNRKQFESESKKLNEILSSKGINPEVSDIHQYNIGIDESGKAKALDMRPVQYPDSDLRKEAAAKMRKTALDKISNTKGAKIFRAIPLIGSALGAYSALNSEDASAAIPLLNEAESVGMNPEDEAIMLAERDALVNYKNSPARFARTKKLLGK